MPIYEFECPKCKHVFEEWTKSPSAEEPCPVCGTPSPRIMSRTSFVLKGDGWYVSDYGYRKGITEEGGSKGQPPAKATPVAPAKQADKTVATQPDKTVAKQTDKTVAKTETKPAKSAPPAAG